MAYRIAYLLLEGGALGSDIVGLSFTNKAARELRERVLQILTAHGRKARARGLIVSTFHSLCVRILRAQGAALGLSPQFTILDASDQLDVLRQVLRHIRIDERKFDPGLILAQISRAKNQFLGPESAEALFDQDRSLSPDLRIACLLSYTKYQEQLSVLQALDFDDLIYQTARLLRDHAAVKEHYNALYRHLLVDEYQDTNPAQFQILQLLTQSHSRICVVGDDDQSIYSWRGADPRHILEFQSHYPQATVLALEQNYRSTSAILEAANHVIAQNTGRYPKRLWSTQGQGEIVRLVVLEDDRAEANFVAEEIGQRGGAPGCSWKDFAILYRSNPQARVFEEALRRLKIPYRILGGVSFLSRKEVKDVLAYFRLLTNPADDSALRRIINWPARGIGKVSLDVWSELAFKQQIPLLEALADPQCTVAPRAQSAARLLHQTIHSLRQELLKTPLSGAALAAWANRVLLVVEARRALEADVDDPLEVARKWENVEELLHAMGQLDAPDESEVTAEAGALGLLQEFLCRMVTQEKEETDVNDPDDERRNQVTLLTLHGSKGLEFAHVYLVGLEEGLLPHRRTIEEAASFDEERRLCYVGLTRARHTLTLSRTATRLRYGKKVERQASRFLGEIPSHLLELHYRADTPDTSSPEALEKHQAMVSDFLTQLQEQLQNSPS